MENDPLISNLLNVALNVASNGLSSLLAKSGQKVEELVVGKDYLEKRHLEKTALQPLLQKAILDRASQGKWETSKGEEVIALFLQTPEVEEIVRQIYSTHWFRGIKRIATKDQWSLVADLSFHDLRHDFAYRAREAGWTLEEIAYYPEHVTVKGTPAIQTTVWLFPDQSSTGQGVTERDERIEFGRAFACRDDGS